MVHNVNWQFLKAIYFFLATGSLFVIYKLLDKIIYKKLETSDHEHSFIEIFVDAKSDNYDKNYVE